MVFGPIKLASGFFRGVRVVHSFSYLYCPMYVSLCSCDLCLFGNSGVQHILCCVFVLLSLRLVYPILQVSLFFSSSCVPNVARFSGLSIWFPLWYSLTFIWKQLAEVCYHIIKNQRIKWKYDYNGDINFPNKPLETTLNISYLLKLQKFWSNCIYVNVAKIVFDAINFYSD